MPPRYAYWTILIDNAPTAFRARDQAELLPTFNQLRRTNPNVAFKWFARGRLWDSPEQAQWAARHTEALREKRGRDWRPGGQHRDPRQRIVAQDSSTQAPKPGAPKPGAPKHPSAAEHPRSKIRSTKHRTTKHPSTRHSKAPVHSGAPVHPVHPRAPVRRRASAPPSAPKKR